MAAKKQKYRINLVDVFDRAYQDKTPEIRSKLKPLLNQAGVKITIGREVIREIQKRTEKGVDKNDSNFTGYSTSYKESLDFKIFNKSSSKVNLKQSGQMLSGMKVNETGGPVVEIHFPSTLQNAKADGHIRGGGNNRSLPVRDFFGLPKDEEDKIVRQAVNDASRDLLTPDIDTTLNQRAQDLFRGANGTTTATVSGSVLADDFFDDFASDFEPGG